MHEEADEATIGAHLLPDAAVAVFEGDHGYRAIRRDGSFLFDLIDRHQLVVVDLRGATYIDSSMSLRLGRVQAVIHHKKAETFPVDRTVEQADAREYDALVLPEGSQALTSYGRTPSPLSSYATSSRAANRSRRSATAPGLLKPMPFGDDG